MVCTHFVPLRTTRCNFTAENGFYIRETLRSGRCIKVTVSWRWKQPDVQHEPLECTLNVMKDKTSTVIIFAIAAGLGLASMALPLSATLFQDPQQQTHGSMPGMDMSKTG